MREEDQQVIRAQGGDQGACVACETDGLGWPCTACDACAPRVMASGVLELEAFTWCGASGLEASIMGGISPVNTNKGSICFVGYMGHTSSPSVCERASRDRRADVLRRHEREPAEAARFAAHSYGFRPGRGTREAVEAIHTTMHRQDCRPWGLDAARSGCFDTMAPEPLWAPRPVCTTTLRPWLQAGVVNGGCYAPTDTGTPQGGVVSPLVANGALDGMARWCDAA